MTLNTHEAIALMDGLSVCHLRFTARATQTVRLGGQPGSAIRGTLYNVLSDRFCPHDNFPDHQTTCPVCWMMAQTDRKGARGENIPRPLTIQPPKPQTYRAGETFQFGLGLVGEAQKLMPYVLRAATQMGQTGIGPGRGRFEVIDIEEVDVLLDAYRPLLEGRQVKQPRLQITNPRVLAETPDQVEKVRIQFRTPMRLIHKKKLLKQMAPDAFIGRLIERCQALATYYSKAVVDQEQWRALYLQLTEQAKPVEVIQDDTRWSEAFSGSRRKGKSTPISGLIGELTLRGDLTEIYPWLLWGQSLHVGKDAVKGNGQYSVMVD